MFKKLYKNKLPILIIALIVTLLSCDGRDRKDKSNIAALKESKLLDSFSENIKYFPEAYFETITDTILNNDFRVIIKTYADMENSVLNEFHVDTILHKHYYRDAITEITVLKNNLEIVSEKLDKSNFLKRYKKLEKYFKTANLSGVWLNQNDSISKDKISIYIMFCKPETDNYFLNEMIINSNGEFSINEIEKKTNIYART